MNLSPLLTAATPIPPHTIAAFTAVIIGAVQFALPKGTRLHRTSGYIWAGLMVFVAASGFFIHTIKLWGMFSPIHILSAITLYTLYQLIRAARGGNVRRHKKLVIILYVLALIVTGAFTFLPGRIMHQVFFG